MRRLDRRRAGHRTREVSARCAWIVRSTNTHSRLQRSSQWFRAAGAAVRRSREAADTNVGVAKHAAGIIGACQGRARQGWLARRSPAARFGATPSRRVLSSARLAATTHGRRRRADHEGRVERSIGRSPAGDRGKIERAPPPREPTLASAPRQTPISRPLDLSGLSTVTADASLGASRYTQMKMQ